MPSTATAVATSQRAPGRSPSVHHARRRRTLASFRSRRSSDRDAGARDTLEERELVDRDRDCAGDRRERRPASQERPAREREHDERRAAHRDARRADASGAALAGPSARAVPVVPQRSAAPSAMNSARASRTGASLICGRAHHRVVLLLLCLAAGVTFMGQGVGLIKGLVHDRPHRVAVIGSLLAALGAIAYGRSSVREAGRVILALG